jgi:hypothetical protein
MIIQYGSGMLQLESAAVYSTATATKFGGLRFLLKGIKLHLPAKTRHFDYGMWNREDVVTS